MTGHVSVPKVAAKAPFGERAGSAEVTELDAAPSLTAGRSDGDGFSSTECESPIAE
jgi:hypothetical protein